MLKHCNHTTVFKEGGYLKSKTDNDSQWVSYNRVDSTKFSIFKQNNHILPDNLSLYVMVYPYNIIVANGFFSTKKVGYWMNIIDPR